MTASTFFKGREIFLTGGTGFVGDSMARRLVELGASVTCLVRKKSDTRNLQKLDVKLFESDLVDSPDHLRAGIAGKQFIFHLASNTHAPSLAEFMRINAGGTENLIKAAGYESRSPRPDRSSETNSPQSRSLQLPGPPTMIFVSSIAAAGPSRRGKPHEEADPSNPISNYGLSKVKCESILREHSGTIPISIVRPPIVLGPRDKNGLKMFQLINDWRFHIIAGYWPEDFSVIHVDDLVESLILVAEKGERMSPDSNDRGIYYANDDQTLTFGQLGKMVAQALNKKALMLPVPKTIIRAVGGINTALQKILHHKPYLTFDKAREATGGSWSCVSDKLKNDTGWRPAAPLSERLKETAMWYRENGWLK